MPFRSAIDHERTNKQNGGKHTFYDYRFSPVARCHPWLAGRSLGSAKDFRISPLGIRSLDSLERLTDRLCGRSRSVGIGRHVCVLCRHQRLGMAE